jgi:hypothetical protein
MGVMMHDDSMDELMGKALREVDPPPPTPREAIWAGIQARRAELAAAASSVEESGPGRIVDLAAARRRRTTWLTWSAAIAATLVLGIGLGRISRTTAPGTATGTTAAAGVEGAGQPADAVPTAYRLAAANHLERTETLLASLSVDSRPGGAREMSSWARELLTDTRLLLSSPAAEDAATRRLLEDLELILAQIAGIPEARAEQEVELIHEGINQSDVLLRLRAATAGPRLVGT